MNGGAIDRLMRRIFKLQKKLVRPRSKPVDTDGFTAGIEPMPGTFINRDMQVSDPGQDARCGGTVDRHDPTIFRPVSDNHVAICQLLRKR